MSPSVTIKELSNLSASELQSEIRKQQMLVRKMRMGITMSKEKDTAMYRREKKALARLETVLTQKKKEALMGGAKAPTVGAPAAKKTAPKRKTSPRSSAKS